MAQGVVTYDMRLNSKGFVTSLKDVSKNMKELLEIQGKLNNRITLYSRKLEQATISNKKFANSQKTKVKETVKDVNAQKQAERVTNNNLKVNSKMLNVMNHGNAIITKNLKVTIARNRAMNESTKSSNRFANVIARMDLHIADRALGSIVKTLFNFSKASLKAANDYREARDAIGTGFGGESGKAMNNWVEANASRLMMSKSELAQNVSDLASVMKGQGYNIEDPAVMKKISDFIYRAADTASNKNKKFGTTVKDFIGAIYAGQTKQGYKYGITLTVAEMQEFMKSKGDNRKYKDLSFKDKTDLKLERAMGQTDWLKGDIAKTKDSPANMERRVQSMYENMKIKVGDQLKEQFTWILGVLSNIISFMDVIVKRFSSWIPWVLGITAAVWGLVKAMEAVRLVMSLIEMFSNSSGFMLILKMAAILMGAVGAGAGALWATNQVGGDSDYQNIGIADTTSFQSAPAASNNRDSQQGRAATIIKLNDHHVGKALSSMSHKRGLNNKYYT